MTETSKFDAWSAGDAYQHYMGRWSGLIADKFVDWLAPPKGGDWLDVGCGTGALTSAILRKCEPASVTAIDQSEGFVNDAKNRVGDGRAVFKTGDAMKIPAKNAEFDVVTSGLVLNFVSDMKDGLLEFQRVLVPGGLLSFYVWDYPGGGMGFIDAFWKAAAKIDPQAAELDESERFPVCTRSGLTDLCRSAGVAAADVAAIEETTVFSDFEEFWRPFTLGAGPAPGYCKSLSEDQRDALKNELASKLGGDGEIRLPARVWAVKAKIPRF